MGPRGQLGIVIVMDRIDRCLYSITSGPILFPVHSLLYFAPVPLMGLRPCAIIDYSLLHNGARRIEHDHSSMNASLEYTPRQ